ncbi:MAG: prolyl oligopeptidase family serine peptidase [Solobacterium sp.]|nr:prolyl oligopeptidase family serine peptidase [Solobacterium sp.]
MGRIEQFRLGIAPLRQNPRKVWVYLPDEYDRGNRVFPVLYMFDGHNLFDDKTATYGKSWGIREYLDENHIPLVVVGADCNHTGNSRLNEYCPYPVEPKPWFGKIDSKGEITARWFVRKLKPACEKRYRIYSDRKHVGIAGSSMGGMMSVYCIAQYNDVYSKAACISPTMDIAIDAMVGHIESCSMSKNTRIYLDFGSQEVRSKKTFALCMDNLLRINHAFQEHNCNTFPNVVVGGTHSEASWQTIFPLAIEYLYPELLQKDRKL